MSRRETVSNVRSPNNSSAASRILSRVLSCDADVLRRRLAGVPFSSNAFVVATQCRSCLCVGLSPLLLDSTITDFGSNLNTLLNLVGRLNKKMTWEEFMASIEKVLIVGGG